MKSIIVSKSKLKPQVVQILRDVEEFRQEVVVTDRGRPVAKILPITEDLDVVLEKLSGSVLEYTDPTEPVEVDWNAIQSTIKIAPRSVHHRAHTGSHARDKG